MQPKSFHDAEYLRDCLTYDPATGILTWKTRPLSHFPNCHAHASWNGRLAGKRAGALRHHGYIFVTIDQAQYLAHRVIWAMQTGAWPKQIDHKNRDCGDNRWDNLREARQQQNLWNRSLPTRELPRGVRKSPRGPRFVARATVNRRYIHLGSFDTPEEAHAAWLAFVEKERGEFLHAE